MHKITDHSLVFLIRSIFFCINLLPNKAQVILTTKLVNIVLLLFPRSKYVTYRNLSICFPNFSKEQKERIWVLSKIVLAKNILGFILGPKLTKEHAQKNLQIDESIKVTEELKSNTGKGVLLLVPHFGSFELLAQYWCLLDKPFAILARGFGLKNLDLWWNNKRQAHGNIIFSRKGGFKDIIEYINNGKNVAILFDQNVKRKHSIFANFFGHPASTAKTIGLVSLKTNCRIIFTTILPNKPNDLYNYTDYKLVAHWVKPPQEREGNDNDKKVSDTISEAHNYLEKYIRQHPEYWFWIHRRFKTRPEGEPENLYDARIFKEDLA